MAELRQNTWSLNAWYEQDYAGNVEYESTLSEFFTFGNNNWGQLGQNSRAGRSSPTQVPGTSWAHMSTANNNDSYHMIATKTDGTLWAWGDNNQGQLAQNNRVKYSSPVQIPGTDWNSGEISREHSASFAIKTNGTLWAWGYNAYGELGQNQAPGNNNANYSSPAQIGSESNWKTIYAGSGCIFATKSDNSLWAWGNGSHGALAMNNDQGYSSPRQVGIAHDISTSYVYSTEPGKIAAGGQTTAAIRTDGTLWVWGSNGEGQLAQNNSGTPNRRSSPIQVGGEDNWKQIAAANSALCAVKTDGTMWIWGKNYAGYLGLNQKEPASDGRSSPTQLPGTDWERVVGGRSQWLAHKTDGTLWTWGRNWSGMLGLNTSQSVGDTHRSSPTQIPGTWDNSHNKAGSIYFSVGALKQL